MQNITYILLAGLCITLVSTAGLLLVKTHKSLANFINNHLTTLTSISAGIFLVTSFVLIRETLELLPLVQAIISFLLGGAFYILMFKFIKPHRHMGDDHTHDAKQSAYRVLFGDTLHNIADGLLLVASFGAGVPIGVSNTISIILHELPQELSEFFVLKRSGYSNNEAIYRNFATAFSVFVGIGMGLVLVQTQVIQAYLLGITATFFLGIVFTDLFPVRKLIKEQKITQNISALIIGIMIMFLVNAFIVGEHSHSHEHEHDSHEHENLIEHNDDVYPFVEADHMDHFEEGHDGHSH